MPPFCTWLSLSQAGKSLAGLALLYVQFKEENCSRTWEQCSVMITDEHRLSKLFLKTEDSLKSNGQHMPL